jgi:hypothetical protein
MTVVGDSTYTDEPKGDIKSNEDKTPVEDQKKEPEKEGVFDDIQSSTMAPVGEDAADVENSSRLPGSIENLAEGKTKINDERYSKSDLMITPEEKAAFIDALVTGERYRQTFSIFGGKINVVIRSRTAKETHAMYSYMRYILSSKGGDEGLNAVEGDMAYVPLVVQIEEMNGKKFPEMKGPLTFEESDGKLVYPGWFEDFKAWKSKPEGLTSALISLIQLFEYKYWTMTKEANNKNFWNTDTSTGE